MKIGTKIFFGFTMVVLMTIALALFSVMTAQKSLLESVGRSSIFLSEETLKRIDHGIFLRAEELQIDYKHFFIPQVVSESNREFEKLENISAYMDQKDKEWVSAEKGEITPFMHGLLKTDLSGWIRNELVQFHENKYGYKIFDEIFVTNKYGAVIALTGRTSDYRQDDETWWQMAKANELYLSDVEYDESTETQVVSVGVRINDENGIFAGVLKAVIAVKAIIREAEITTKKYETTRIMLITENGRLIYRSKAFRFFEDMSGKDFFRKIEGKEDFFTAMEGGKKRLFSYVRSKGYRGVERPGWILVMTHDLDEILRPAILLRNRIISASFILVSLAIIIALIMSRNITKPIIKLTEGAKIIGEGNLDYKVEIKGRDETGYLGQAFNEMVDRRKKAEKALMESEERLLLSLVAGKAGIWDWNIQDGTVIWDDHMQRIFGLEPGSYDGRFQTWADLVHPDDRERAEKATAKSAETGEPYECEYRVRSQAGVWRYVTAQAVVKKDGQGQPLRMVGIAIDITQRKRAEEALQQLNEQLEQRVKERTKQLEEAQEQLVRKEKLAAAGQIASSIGHELRNPLGVIGNSVYYLKTKFKDGDEKLLRHLDILQREIDKSRTIISDLLDFSRVSLPSLKGVNVNSVIKRTLAEMEIPRNTDLTTRLSEDLPVMNADPGQIQQVFLNIISNAVQAMPEGGRLEIATGTRDGFIEIMFRDTGAGISEENLRKIFEPLFTTKSKGIGLGLAIVKSIIDGHKGEIAVESEVEKGTTFTVKLPIEDRQ